MNYTQSAIMKQIPLGKSGKFAIVDDEDYEWVFQWRWDISANGYAVRYKVVNKKRKSYSMHRMIARTPKNMDTDHKNHNKLDNRKENLRACTTSQNAQNRRNNKNPLSQSYCVYRGVYCKKTKNTIRYFAKIMVSKKSIHLGSYENDYFAARAYDEAAKKYHGEFATLNFLPNIYEMHKMQ